MATNQVTPRRSQPQPFNKPALYEAIFIMNRDLGLVVDDFNRLREFRFSRRYIDAFIVKIEEIRAWANGEFLERQHDRELKDWFHWERLDHQFEQRFKDPNDVLIDAKRLQEQQAAEEQHVLTEADRIREQRAAEKRRDANETN
jgi:hypothetical protein